MEFIILFFTFYFKGFEKLKNKVNEIIKFKESENKKEDNNIIKKVDINILEIGNNDKKVNNSLNFINIFDKKMKKKIY